MKFMFYPTLFCRGLLCEGSRTKYVPKRQKKSVLYRDQLSTLFYEFLSNCVNKSLAYNLSKRFS